MLSFEDIIFINIVTLNRNYFYYFQFKYIGSQVVGQLLYYFYLGVDDGYESMSNKFEV